MTPVPAALAIDAPYGALPRRYVAVTPDGSRLVLCQAADGLDAAVRRWSG